VEAVHPAPLLEIEGLTVVFRREQERFSAVEGLDLAVGRGETVGLVGESGCGKTVTALAVMGLLPRPAAGIAAGRIRFDGIELADPRAGYPPGIRGRRAAMVFQEPLTSLNPVLAVGEQIAEVLRFHLGLPAGQARERARALLAEVRLSRPAERLGDYPHRLSGGERQRVMIAIALACSPDLLIADEPTTALDVTVQAQILGLLGELKRRRRLAVLYITHDLGLVSRIAERVAVMYAGQLVEAGPAAAVLKQPLHPYTRALLAALPGPHKRGRRLAAIPGAVPHPGARPGGCAFHPRCPLALASCRRERPPLACAPGGRAVRCPVTAGIPAPRGPRS